MIAIDVLLFLFFVALAILSVKWARLVFGDGLSPLGLYLVITFSSLALWNLRLVSLIQISGLVYFIILLSIFGFCFGAFIAAPKNFLFSQRSVTGYRLIVIGRGQEFFFYTIGVLSTIGWIVLLIMFVRDYSLITVWTAPEQLQFGFQSRRYVGYLNLLGILVLPSYVLLVRAGKRTGWLAFILVISALVGLLLAGIKSYLIFSVVTAFLAWGRTSRVGMPLRHMVTIAVCVIIIMVLYDQTIDIFTQKHAAESVLNTTAPGLYRPYVYIVGSWSALTVLAEIQMPRSIWAENSLSFFWKLLGDGLGLIESVPPFAEYMEIAAVGSHSFNVYSMVGGLYLDFGLLGVLVGSVFWGGVSTRLYEKSIKSFDWAWILCSSIISYGLFLSFFTYYFTFNLLFLLIIVFVFIVFRMLVNGSLRVGND